MSKIKPISEKAESRAQDFPTEAPASVKDHDVIYALRTAHQNQTQLLILADQKANVLIGIVAVSVTIIFTNVEFLASIDAMLLYPFIAFIVIEIAALMLALMVIMPKNVSHNGMKDISKLPNPLFFGFFTRFPQDDYLDFIRDNMADDASARHMLTKDFYQIGMVLRRKYMLVKYAYMFAVLGLIMLLGSTVIFMILNN